MKTKTTVEILEINHEDLVELLSTALYGSYWLGCEYRVGDNMETVEFNDTDTCFEDKAARCLLQGKYIEFFDQYAEGEEDFYNSKLEHYWVEDDCMVYKVTLKDIKDGLERMLEQEKGWGLECAMNFVKNEYWSFDLTQAECIIQHILWGEDIYG